MLCFSFFLAACGELAPVTPPPQLEYTPGPLVVIADDVYHSAAFTVKTPPNWQIVTSPASSPPWVVFISPDEDAVIVIAVDEQDTVNVQPPQIEGQLARQIEQVILADGRVVYVMLVAGEAVLGAMNDDFQQVVESLDPA